MDWFFRWLTHRGCDFSIFIANIGLSWKSLKVVLWVAVASCLSWLSAVVVCAWVGLVGSTNIIPSSGKSNYQLDFINYNTMIGVVALPGDGFSVIAPPLEVSVKGQQCDFRRFGSSGYCQERAATAGVCPCPSFFLWHFERGAMTENPVAVGHE